MYRKELLQKQHGTTAEYEKAEYLPRANVKYTRTQKLKTLSKRQLQVTAYQFSRFHKRMSRGTEVIIHNLTI